jgi:serine/threonine protein phosphatase PrpC
MAHARARVARVDRRVHQAVERHGRRPRAHHGHHDPASSFPTPRARASAGMARNGQQRAGQRERQGENGVLELDHLERQAAGLDIASVGDSRAYMMDAGGLHAITEDQTWVNEVGRPLGLDEESLRNHPMRHVLTMAIGASVPLTVNCYSVALETGSLILLCSDGLHGVVDAGQLQQILEAGRSGAHLEESCRRLIEAAKEAGGPDNVTAILMRKAA